MTTRSWNFAVEIATTLVVAAIALYVVVLRDRRPANRQPATTKAVVTPAGAAEADFEEWYSIGHLMGSADAPVRLVEFGSFRCGFCADLHFAIDSVQRRYPGLISLRWVHRVGPASEKESSDWYAALASECAGAQGRFEAFYGAYFTAGRRLDSRGDVVRLAEEAGVPSVDRFRACLDARTYADTILRHVAAAERTGSKVTPTWYINDRLIVGAVTTAQLDSMVLAVVRVPRIQP